jgi:apolipoprotein N-acyltransferase
MRVPLRPSRAEAVAALLSAVLFSLSFPPIPLVVPAFVCLIPVSLFIVRAADGVIGPRAVARVGFWLGMLGYGAALYWIGIALSIYTSLAWLGYVAALLVVTSVVTLAALGLFAMRRLTRWPMAILLPLVWTASEVVFNYMSDLSFPWLPLGLSLARVPLLAQAADLSGVRGLSFWIAATNGLFVDAWLDRTHTPRVAVRMAAVVGMLAAVAGYGAWRLRTTVLRDVAPIGIVQPNIPQTDKWQEENRGRIFGILTRLTGEELAAGSAKLVLWPEASMPDWIVNHPEWIDSLSKMARRSRTPILVGILDVTFRSNTDYEGYNAAALVDSLGRYESQPNYHKSYLVPIVERVPFINPRWFSNLRYFGGLGRGGDPPVYRLGFGQLGVLICYESIFPQRSRYYRRHGADILVNITNDAWFGRSLAPYQHESHLAFRAIENRVGIVRAANTGISAYIDPLGRFHGETPLEVAAVRTYQAQTTDVRTLYVMLGDWIGSLSLIITLVACFRAVYPKLRRG